MLGVLPFVEDPDLWGSAATATPATLTSFYHGSLETPKLTPPVLGIFSKGQISIFLDKHRKKTIWQDGRTNIV